MTSLDWLPPTAIHDSDYRALIDVLPLYERCVEPATADSIFEILTRLRAHFWRADEDGGAEIVLEDWIRDLAWFPEWAIRDACDGWRRAETKRPAIADIRASCQNRVRRAYQRLARLRALAATPVVADGAPIAPRREYDATRERLHLEGLLRPAS